MAQTPPETEREALVALYNATGGPNWEGNNNWLSDVPISEWEGVTTDDNGRVTQLNLRWNQLSGEVHLSRDLSSPIACYLCGSAIKDSAQPKRPDWLPRTDLLWPATAGNHRKEFDQC